MDGDVRNGILLKSVKDVGIGEIFFASQIGVIW